MKTSTSIGSIAKSMADAQAEMQNPAYDASNPHFRSKFASLAAVRNAVIPVFAKHGISVTQELTNEPGGIGCLTVLMHASGEWVAYGPFVVAPTKDDAQGRGSASTYARRYALQAVAGVVGDEDDDAEGAQGRSVVAARINPRDDGDALSAKQQGFAQEFANGFRQILAADCDEGERANRLEALRAEANEDKPVFVAAWDLLASAERSAINKYLKTRKAA
jgi:hypothetical protein